MSWFTKKPKTSFKYVNETERTRIANESPLMQFRDVDIAFSTGYYLVAETPKEKKAWKNRILRIRDSTKMRVLER